MRLRLGEEQKRKEEAGRQAGLAKEESEQVKGELAQARREVDE